MKGLEPSNFCMATASRQKVLGNRQLDVRQQTISRFPQREAVLPAVLPTYVSNLETSDPVPPSDALADDSGDLGRDLLDCAADVRNASLSAREGL